MPDPAGVAQIFDRSLVRLRRERSAARLAEGNFLRSRIFADVVDRLETAQRLFADALLIGADDQLGALSEAAGVGRIVTMDLAANRLGAGGVCGDEEALPFADRRFDLIVSFLTMHAVNDPVGVLVQTRRILLPDGLFIGVAFGEDTLTSLRDALVAAEVETTGGAARRIYPFAGVRDFGSAMQRAGFALPVVDRDRIAIDYANPMRVFDDLKALGERSALAGVRPPLRREALAHVLAALNGQTVNFDIVTMTGWAPHHAQQKPARRGSGVASLESAVLNVKKEAP